MPYLYDRYVFKALFLTAIFTTLTLTAIILLTQSLKFLELIINAGASSGSFWILTLLALPRFLEVILPVALMISTVFIYNRMMSDSEIVVMRAAGVSPIGMARPAIILATLITLVLIFITTWLAPVSLSNMQKMRQVIKAQYSTLLFREGVFNSVGKDLTVYINNRNANGELEGLLIHDSRSKLPQPVTIIAKRGIIVSSDEGQQVLVYEGSRQEFNNKTSALNRLDFERYSIDLPEAAAVRKRWKEPDERTFWELFNLDVTNQRDIDNEKKFIVEAHKRIVGPFLALSFTLVALCCLLLGPVNRRGQAGRVATAVIATIILQGLYLSIFNLAQKNLMGLILMYVIVLAPLFVAIFILSSWGEKTRHKIMYKAKEKNTLNRKAST